MQVGPSWLKYPHSSASDMLRLRHMGQFWMVIQTWCLWEWFYNYQDEKERENLIFSGFCFSEYSTLNHYSHLSTSLKFRLKHCQQTENSIAEMLKSNLWVQSHLSHVRLSATLGTVACQALLSMSFSRQEYWSGLPCPRPYVSSISRLVLQN